MPSALETLVKILKLEQDTHYKNTAVIGGLESYADNWARDAHRQAKRPEHHQLIDELVRCLDGYGELEDTEERHESIKYMIGRITGRIPPPQDLPPSEYQNEADETAPPPPQAEADEALDVHHTPEPEGEPPVSKPEKSSAPSMPRRRHREPLSPEAVAERYAELRQPVTSLHRIGSKMAEKLDKLSIQTVEDMLFAFPRRYDDYSQMKPLNRVRPGEVVTVVAAVRSIEKKQGQGKRPYLLLSLDDGTRQLRVAFFGQLWLQRQFKRDAQVVLSGEIDLFRGELMMTNPEWEMVERDNLHTGRIVPVYALTKGLSARTMRRLMDQVLGQWANRLPDYMPQSVLERTNLVDLDWAVQQIHYPDSFDTLGHAQTRLSFDELFIFQMGMLANRRDWQAEPGIPLQVGDEWIDQFLASLPYDLTGAQRRALAQIRADMARDVPTNRLLQGDVGSGKTVLAAVALGIAVQQGKQAALMAPTSILAEQHARTISQVLANSPVAEQARIRLLTGNTSDADRQEIYAGLANGSINVVIGTHALIQAGVEFQDLALAVIDEQHRFGVEQRGTLRGKGTNPHILVMTATPIPRTLALTLYADLDLSIIDEMPPGRTPVETRVIHSIERERAYEFIRTQISQGRQAFVVYPLVETSEKLSDLGAAVDEFERLRDTIFPRCRVGLLHGKMSPGEKETIMTEFAVGNLDILVSTSVVEVGIDVPNASVILIENAEHFGLAQLHQFRGRVGRGEHKSYCLLLAGTSSEEANQRLAAMEETTDGFRLAEIDWEMRGPGDLLGLRQSGLGQFSLAELMNPRLVELAQREARTVYAEDPNLTYPEHHLLAQRVQALLDRRADVS